MGLVERLRREKITKQEKLKREWEQTSAKIEIERAREAERERLAKEREAKAKAYLENSHFPEIIKILKDEKLIKYTVDYYVWDDSGYVSYKYRSNYKTEYADIKGRPNSVGYYFSKTTLNFSRSPFSGTVEWDYFAIEATSEGQILLHSKKPTSIRFDSSFEAQDRALEVAHANPLHERKEWSTSSDVIG